MSTTQEHIPIRYISDDIVFLKDGGGALILQVSAVNFGLLSEREQIAIISSFAQMLNSLSFSIQIIIHSKRLNISSYLNLLDNAKKSQTNPLLSQMIGNYRQFIQTLIKENEVLDKKFFCIIPLFRLELGLVASQETLKQKIKTILLPRRDQVIRQLARAGLKANQLTNNKLIELFYDLYNYNEATPEAGEADLESTQTQHAQLKTPPAPMLPKPAPPIPQSPPPRDQRPPIIQTNPSRTHPFVVEELEEG